MPRRKAAPATTRRPKVETREFIRIVRQYMYENGIDQRELAARAGLVETRLSRVLNNPGRMPEFDMVVALADAMSKKRYDMYVAAGYPLDLHGAPSDEAQRLFVLMDDDPRLRDALLEHYMSVAPNERESLLRFLEAMRAARKTQPPDVPK